MSTIIRILPQICLNTSRNLKFHLIKPSAVSRGYKRYVRPTMREFYKRRIAAGPEPDRPRSAWVNWNYKAEVYAFGARLQENFTQENLQVAFTHQSYIDAENDKRSELELDGIEVALNLQNNDDLAVDGYDTASTYIKAYIKHTFPRLPNEGVDAIHNYILSENMLAYVSSHIGTNDIILSSEYPLTSATLAKTLMAVVGALAKDQGKERAKLFVQDFIITQLKGKELSDLWDVVNPMGLLRNVLESQGREEPEPRLLWETGSETVVAAYVVGIYSNKQLIGQSPGETLTIAEEMAARDALRKLFGLMDNDAPLKFGEEGHKLDLDMQC